MTISEFRAWLDGFMYSFGDIRGPNYEEWSKILDKLNEVETSRDIAPKLDTPIFYT